MERGTVRLKCLAQEHNTVSPPEIEPGPFDPETRALTMRPTRDLQITPTNNGLHCLHLIPFKVQFIVAFLPRRIHFNELNPTEIRLASESTAAFLPHFRLVLSHFPTGMRHRFKRRISAVSNLMLMFCACVNLVPPKRKKKLGHSRPNVTWTYCKTNCFVSLPLLVPLADIFRKI